MFWSNIFRKFWRKRRKLFNDWPQFWKGCMILVCVFGFWRTWRLQTIVVICVTRHAAKNLLQPRTEEVPWNSCHPLIMVPSQASWSKMDSSRPPNKWARPHSPPILDRYRYEEIFYLKKCSQPDVCLFMAFLNTLITFENQRQFQESRARVLKVFFTKGHKKGINDGIVA